jgi:hypothetical protein
VIVSVGIAEPGAAKAQALLLRGLRSKRVEGLRYAALTTTTELGDGLLPRLRPGRIGLIAAWEDDGCLDAFESAHPLGQELAEGWQARMKPLRVSGSWSGIEADQEAAPADPEEPIAVLTLGRLRPTRLFPFLRSAAAAERELLQEPDVLASCGLGRPPLVSTFSLWRTVSSMRDYAYRSGGMHLAAVDAERANPFHSSSAFVRLRPYASRGSWAGGDPLGQALTPA